MITEQLIKESRPFFNRYAKYYGYGYCEKDFIENMMILKNSGHCVFTVRIKDGIICGMLGLLIMGLPFNKKILAAQEMFFWTDDILPRHTRGKLMLSMLKEAEGICRDKKCRFLNFSIMPGNDFVNYLEKKGYRKKEVNLIKEL